MSMFHVHVFRGSLDSDFLSVGFFKNDLKLSDQHFTWSGDNGSPSLSQNHCTKEDRE